MSWPTPSLLSKVSARSPTPVRKPSNLILMSLQPASTKTKISFKDFLLQHTVEVLYFKVALISFLVVPEHYCHRDPDILKINHEVPRTFDRDKLEQFSISPEASNWITMKVISV